jgi:hypothetical protein
MRTGVLTSVVLFLAGIWVAVMPEVAGFHPASGNPWTAPSLVAAVLGGGIALSALVGLVGFFSQWLGEREQMLREAAKARAAEDEERKRVHNTEPAAGSGSEGVRTISEGREASLRRLSRVERAQERTSVRGEDDAHDMALKELAETILKDLQKSPAH